MYTQKFENSLFAVQVTTNNGQSQFNAESVAKSLGLCRVAKSGNAVVRWERVNKYLGEPCPKVGTGDFITEMQVYLLAFKANNSLAEAFQAWLAGDVLPAIRKNGAFLTDEKIDEALRNPNIIIQLATQVKEEREKNLIVVEKMLEMAPKAAYYDTILKSKKLISMSFIAKNYGMSARKMNILLHRLGIQYPRNNTWLLYSRYQDRGYAHAVMKLLGSSEKALTCTKWTQKGREFIYNFLKSKGIYPMIER